MNNKDSIIIIGAGGHAKVVLSTLIAAGENVAGLVDDDPVLWGTQLLGYSVLGPLSYLANKPRQAAIIGIGNNKVRQKVASAFNHLTWKTVIHPFAYVHDSTSLGVGTVVCAGAVIQPDSKISNHVIINTSASVDHDCCIKNFVHIAPGSHLAGGVTVGEGTLIGVGCSAIFGIEIGSWTTIGVGSAIVKPIGNYVYAKGVPAREYKKMGAISKMNNT